MGRMGPIVKAKAAAGRVSRAIWRVVRWIARQIGRPDLQADALVVLGAAMLFRGASMIYPPAGFLLLGVLCLGLGLAAAMPRRTGARGRGAE